MRFVTSYYVQVNPDNIQSSDVIKSLRSLSCPLLEDRRHRAVKCRAETGCCVFLSREKCEARCDKNGRRDEHFMGMAGLIERTFVGKWYLSEDTV